jgi:hypothetical protein
MLGWLRVSSRLKDRRREKRRKGWRGKGRIGRERGWRHDSGQSHPVRGILGSDG